MESKNSTSVQIALREGIAKPGSGVGPVPISRGPRNPQYGGRILDRQSSEMAEFNQPRGDRIIGGKPSEGSIQGEQSFVRTLAVVRDITQLDPVKAAAVFLGPLPAGGIHEDSSHGLCSRCEEVPAVLPANPVGSIDESEVRLVDQGSRLKGLVRRFGCHARGREFPQLVIDERQKFGGSLAVACRSGVK
jgi:hypothetical protein